MQAAGRTLVVTAWALAASVRPRATVSPNAVAAEANVRIFMLVLSGMQRQRETSSPVPVRSVPILPTTLAEHNGHWMPLPTTDRPTPERVQ
ncbi:hypothetical protein GCM10010441_39990 [Kitasatospora paracochleata]